MFAIELEHRDRELRIVEPIPRELHRGRARRGSIEKLECDVDRERRPFIVRGEEARAHRQHRRGDACLERCFAIEHVREIASLERLAVHDDLDARRRANNLGRTHPGADRAHVSSGVAKPGDVRCQVPFAKRERTGCAVQPRQLHRVHQPAQRHEVATSGVAKNDRTFESAHRIADDMRDHVEHAVGLFGFAKQPALIRCIRDLVEIEADK